MELELITIIVPVYNAEKYLSKCLNSLKEQSYQNLEIIMINDGSTDSSVEICNEFCKSDNRFTLIEQKNKGLSMARNTGLDYMHGKYVFFLDSDDYIHKECIELLYENAIEFEADISMCNYVKFKNGQVIEKKIYNEPIQLLKKEMILDISTTGVNNRSERIVLACNKLIKSEIFQNLRFPNRIHEDEFMIHRYILQAKKIVWTDAVLYYYRQHDESITGKKNRKDLKHLAVLEAVRMRIKAFSGNEYEDVFLQVLCSYFENAIIQFLLLACKENKKKLIWRIYPQYLCTLIRYSGRLSRRQFLHYLLFLISPQYYRKRYWD